MNAPPSTTRIVCLLVVFAAGLAALAGLAVAGPLQPSAGPVVSTMKPLTEVEPRTAVNAANTPGSATAVFVISTPGSYYLTGNVSVTAGKIGVAINSDNVTLDLNGFSVLGPTSASTLVYSGSNLVTVRNGFLTGGAGGASAGSSAKFSGLTVKGCAGIGLMASGESTVSDCNVSQCSASGIYMNNWQTLVERCHVSYCGGDGIAVGKNCTVVSCTSTNNTLKGFTLSGTARDCSAAENGSEGFYVSLAGALENCTSRENTGSGFKLYSGSSAHGCTSQGNNAFGFDLDAETSVVGCSGSANAVSAVRVSGSYTRVEGCTLRGVGGFPVVQVSNVVGATIEKNSLYQGTFAVSADANASGLLITGNQCFGNTSGGFNVGLANNQVGPTVNAAGTISSTNPWANFVR